MTCPHPQVRRIIWYSVTVSAAAGISTTCTADATRPGTANRTGQAHVLANLGIVDLRQGRYDQATSFHQQALALFRETGDPAGEAEALNGLGEVLLATSQPGSARAQHAAALAVTSQTGDKYEQARAHVGLARSHDAAGESAQADHHRRQALALYTSLGAPEANQIRARLAAGNPQPR